MNPKTKAVLEYVARELGIRAILTIVALMIVATILPKAARAGEGVDQPLAAETRYVQAMENYEDNRWHLAFAQFVALADQGHGQAARMAWMMWRHGPELFDQGFSAAPMQRQRWLDTWHCASGEGQACATLATER